MELDLRSYRTGDLPGLLALFGHACAAADLAIGMHPGDLAHHLTNTMRGADPAPHFHVLDGADGQPLALVELFKGNAFDYVIHPDLRGGETERALILWAVGAQKRLMSRLGLDHTTVATDTLSGDAVKRHLLDELGFTPAPQPFMALNIRDLHAPIPAPVLPDGFTIRPAAGLHEAGALGAVHASAFKSNWTAERYAAVMQTPGFDIERELVVVAPSGEFAAFLIYWPDPVSQSGLFEPVGCAEAYQRRGLTRALMLHTLALLREKGMTRASVNHLLDNPASTAAYASVGFVRAHVYTEYERSI